MHEEWLNVQSMLSEELTLKPNCFTLKDCSILEEGIEMSLDTGPDPNEPWLPHFEIGKYRVNCDTSHKCLYHLAEGNRPIVRRAYPVKKCREGQRPYYVLRNPGNGKLVVSLIKVYLGTSATGKAVAGVSGVRTVIAYNNDISLVVLSSGETGYFFFVNGEVRMLSQDGETLRKKFLSPMQMVKLRITDAWERLRKAKILADEEKKNNAVHYILYGMTYVLDRSKRYSDVGRFMRVAMVDEFFRKLSVTKYAMIQPECERILKEIDPKLLPLLNRPIFRPRPEVFSVGNEKANES